MLKLNKITIEGYKSIKQCRDLPLGNLNILIGANGSGKSNFLSFFKLLNFAMTNALQEYIGRGGGGNSLLHFGAKNTRHLAASLDMESNKGVNLYRMRLAYAAPDTLMFTEESLVFKAHQASDDPKLKFLGPGHRESALLSSELAANFTAKFFRDTLSKFRFYQFHDTSEESRLRGRCNAGDDRYLYSNGGNLAAYLWAIRKHHPEDYQRIVETVRLAFPLLHDFVLEPEHGGEQFVMLRWKAAGAVEYDFGPHQLSDGTLRFVALTSLLLQPRDWLPSLIAIDEPELGLHPYAIKLLASLLAEASQHTQILVATQSAALVDQMASDDVIVANTEAGVSHLERLDKSKLESWLNEYRLSELWEMNVIGGRP